MKVKEKSKTKKRCKFESIETGGLFTEDFAGDDEIYIKIDDDNEKLTVNCVEIKYGHCRNIKHDTVVSMITEEDYEFNILV